MRAVVASPNWRDASLTTASSTACGGASRATSSATRRSAACSSASVWRAARACEPAIAVPASSAKRDSCSSMCGGSEPRPAATKAPHSRSSARIGAAALEEYPWRAARSGHVPDTSDSRSIRAVRPVRQTRWVAPSPSPGARIPTVTPSGGSWIATTSVAPSDSKRTQRRERDADEVRRLCDHLLEHVARRGVVRRELGDAPQGGLLGGELLELLPALRVGDRVGQQLRELGEPLLRVGRQRPVGRGTDRREPPDLGVDDHRRADRRSPPPPADHLGQGARCIGVAVDPAGTPGARDQPGERPAAERVAGAEVEIPLGLAPPPDHGERRVTVEPDQGGVGGGNQPAHLGDQRLEDLGARGRLRNQGRHPPQRRLLGGGRAKVIGIRRGQVRPLICGAEPRRPVLWWATVSDRRSREKSQGKGGARVSSDLARILLGGVSRFRGQGPQDAGERRRHVRCRGRKQRLHRPQD